MIIDSKMFYDINYATKEGEKLLAFLPSHHLKRALKTTRPDVT